MGQRGRVTALISKADKNIRKLVQQTIQMKKSFSEMAALIPS
jgi:hypothetical protein